MSGDDLRSILATLVDEYGFHETADDAAEQALLARLGDSPQTPDDPDHLSRTLAILEAEAIAAYRTSTGSSSEAASARLRAEELFGQAGSCARLMVELRARQIDVRPVDEGFLPAGLDLPFRVAVGSLVSRRTSDARLELRSIIERGDLVAAHATDMDHSPTTWDQRLLVDTFGAFILLVRKQDGWEDIYSAMAALQRLRGLQNQMQEEYLVYADAEGRSSAAAAKLVALFHFAQTVTLAGHFLRTGEGSVSSLLSRLDRHRDHAQEAIAVCDVQSGNATLSILGDLLWAGCRELVRNSIWAHVEGLGDQVSLFVQQLAGEGRSRPVLELWPSQQQALASNILDQYRRAVIVQMPTSAGKTLLAEFLIIHSRTLLPSATVAYVVPTRALVNQVTRDLRGDLGPLGMTVEQAVPAYELDPAEQAMLSDAPSILVTTPEKFSLLIRRNEPSVASVGLIIVDEAHSLGDGQRGARLELLLATIRRDRPGARYLLLSPFLPNAQQLVDWLGDDRGLPPIRVDWRPGRRVLATASIEGRRPNREMLLSTLDAAGATDLSAGHVVKLGSVSNSESIGSKTIKATTRIVVNNLRARGTTLVLCRGAGTAMSRAGELAEDLPFLPTNTLRDAVSRYLQAEYGEDLTLSRNLRKGVAYHHAGMSQEARLLIECLIRRNLVHTICGTTTLAQGVNFPITSVVIETKQKGRNGQLSYADLWNIVGRAGRALVDDAGLIVFPIATKAQSKDWQEFLRGEAQQIASQLSTVIDQADSLGETLGLREVRNLPELGDMLQFLAHAMHVGGARQTAADLEDLLRSSLVYRQAAQIPDRADSLVRLCRRYLAQIAKQPGQAALSDQTGFSTPTIAMLLASRSDNPSLTNSDHWQPSVLFGEDATAMTLRMRVLGDVPELGLGWEEAGTFNPWLAGQIVTGWVNGKSLAELTDEFASPDPNRREQDIAEFARNLYTVTSYKASWGLGALEATYLAEPEAPDPSNQSRYVPSMVYFGVRTPEAVWMRMAGLPRVAALGAGELWSKRVGEPPTSHRQLREWLSSLGGADWNTIVRGQSLGGEDMRQLWEAALV